MDSTRIKFGDVVVVDAGDWAPDSNRPTEEPKLGFLLDMANLMGYDALGVGERELAFGLETFKGLATKSKAPVISSNLIDKKTGKPVFKTHAIVKKGGLKVGIFAVIGPKIDLPGNASELVTIDDPIATAQQMVEMLRKQVDVVICLAHVGRVEGEDLAAQVPGMDVVILAHHPGFVAQGRRVNNTITVASGEQGQNVGFTQLTMEGKKVVDLSSETRILMPEVGDNEQIAKLTKEFEDQLNEAARKAQQSQAIQSSAPRAGEDQYLGSGSCMNCHKSQYDQWQTTQHAHAFATLERAKKDSTPECVQCHVVGFGRSGGFTSASATAKLKDVGCESCHGYGTGHDMFARTGGKVDEAVCLTCHTPANDPGWNYAAKLPRVSH